MGEMISKEQARETVQKALGYSKTDETEAILTVRDSHLTRFANNSIHQNVTEGNRSLSVRVILGQKTGRAQTNGFSPESIESAVRTAIQIAEVQRENPELVPLPEGQEYERIDGFVEATAALGPEERAEEVARVVDLCRKDGLTGAGAFSNEDSVVAVANSKGLFAYYRDTVAKFSVTAMGEDSSGWAIHTAKDAREIDTESLGHTAIEKALASRNPKEIEPGEYTVILEEPAVGEIVMFLGYLGFGALALQEGRSFMSGKIGQRISGENITIVDDAFHPQTIGMPFDYEGMPKQRVVIIEDGIAKGVVYDRTTAAKEGRESTGHGLPAPNAFGPLPFNLVVEGGNTTLEEMIASTELGILITRFWYTTAVDPMQAIISGMTRDGTFLIENGKIIHGLKNLRFSQNMLEAFSRVGLISERTKLCPGDDRKFRWGAVAPAMKIEGFKFTSKTMF